jgi:metallo-beta-lactamase family protein
MKIKFLGASGTVTGSGYLITTSDNKQYIIDFGMFQGTEDIAKLNHLPLEFSPGGISAVFLTHAHLDHSGRLPLLAKHGFKGNFYMTKATSVLAEIVMFDSAKIASFDEINEPIYSEEDVITTLERVKTVDYRKPFKVDNLEVVFRDAGHILGSSFIEIKDTKTGQKITFSGDLGNTPELLMKPTDTPQPTDIVVVESTYGDRNHVPQNPSTLLAMEINKIEKEGGTLLIPAFSIERTQVLLYMIKNLKKAKMIQNSTPVYLDSPMAIRATKAYRDYCFLFNKEILKDTTHQDPFFFPELHIIRSTKKSKLIKKVTGPKVIMAGSGMMTGGRILNHAAEFLPRKDTTILFVGFQAEQTTGREIADGAKEVFIEDKSVKVNAKISK